MIKTRKDLIKLGGIEEANIIGKLENQKGGKRRKRDRKRRKRDRK